MCAGWRESFENVPARYGSCPAGLTLDRIDNDGPYAPETCRWATWSVQRRNQRPRRSREADHSLLDGQRAEPVTLDGARGPKPKPSAIDKLDGHAQHHKRNRKRTKTPAERADVPGLAAFRSHSARDLGERGADDHPNGLPHEGGPLALRRALRAAALYRRASQRLHRAPKKGGDVLLTDTKANGKQPRPEINIAKGALEGLRQLAAAFGMSPSDRKGLEVDLGAAGARGGSETGSPTKPKAGAAIEIDAFLRRRESRRSS